MNTESEQKSAFGIREKLLVGFTAITLFLVISVVITLFSISITKNFSERVQSIDLPILDNFIDLNSEIANTQLFLEEIILTRNTSSQTPLLKTWEHIEEFTSAIDAKSNHLNLENISAWQDLKSALQELKMTQQKIIEAIIQSQFAVAEKLILTSEIPLSKTISKKLNDLANTNKTEGILDKQTKTLYTDLQKILTELNNVKILEYALLLTSIIAALLIALYTARKILHPLNNAINIAKKIAAGERDLKIKATTNDETGELLQSLSTMQKSIIASELKLKDSENKTKILFDDIVKSAKLFSSHSSRVAAGDFRQHLEIAPNANEDDIMIKLGKDLNSMTDNLANITNEITQACANMVTTLEETRHAVDVQSSGASEQASSINEITASISEIEKSSSQTMDKAKMLGEVAERTREKGQGGLEAVETCIQAMKVVRDKVQMIAQTILDLSNQTQQVGEITAVVNNLAQQSKMLALNASIEAAKAGESGKGFAVVAVEVKKLAEQSEESTTQVQKILEDIRHAAEKAVMVTEEGTKEVDKGMNLVEQTGETIRRLNEVIHETAIASQQIEAAIRQESAGIEQITVGMNEINQVTSSFVNSVKQSSEAMNNLSTISQNLKQQVDTYKT